MKILLHLIHASAPVVPLFAAALRARGVDVDIVTVLPPAAAAGALSSAYAQLADRWEAEGLTPAQGLLRDYPGASGSYQGWILAAWSAGYKLIERALTARDARAIHGVVMLDSGHAALDSDGTASDQQLAPFLALAKRAVEGEALFHIAHTDVPTPQTGPGAFASTMQWACELMRLATPDLTPPKAPAMTEEGLFRVQAFDREPPARAREEHIGALTAWGAVVTAQAIEAWVRANGALPLSLGARALMLAIGELGVCEEPLGSNTGARVREYLAPCERGGKLLRLVSGPWCAAFASWCARAAGAAGPYRASVAELVNDAYAANTWEPVGHVPVPGDLAIFRRDGQDPTLGGSGHVGRVERVDGDRFSCIEGNYEHRVARVERSRNDPDLVGWVRCSPMPDAVSMADLARGALAAGLDRMAREALEG